MSSYSVEAVLKVLGADKFERSFKAAAKSVEGLEKQADRMRSIGGGFKDLGGVMTKYITKPATIAATAIGGIAIAGGFKRLIGIDTAKAKLKALGHDAEGVEIIMTSALDSVKGTAFGLADAATIAASAVAAGVKPGEELTRYLTLTGDAAAIAGVELADMGDIFNKVTTSGVASNVELKQLADRGIPIYEYLGQAMGTTAQEAKKMASEGKVSSELFLQSIEENIGGAAGVMGAESFTAAWANTQAALSRVGAAFLDAGGEGGGFFSAIKPLMAEITGIFDNMGDTATEWGVKLGESFAQAIEKIREMVQWWKNLDEGTQNFYKKLAVFAVVAGPVLTFIGNMIIGAANLLQGIAILKGMFVLFATAIGVGAGVLLGWIVVIGAVIAIGVLLWKNWDTIKEKAQELGTKISEVWENIRTWSSETWESITTSITDAVMGAWNAVTEWFGQLPTWFSETWNSIVESVTEWATNMIEKAIEVGTQFVENISTFFSELPYNVGFFLGEVIGSVIVWGIEMWNKAKETASNFIEAITTFFSELPSRVSGLLTTTWTNVTTWASNMWTKAKETGANFINGIVNWFSQLPARISTWVTNVYNNVVTWASNMATKAKQAGSDFVNGVITFVQTLPGKIQTWLTNTIGRLTTWSSNMGNKGREAGTDLLNKAVNAVKGLPGKMATAGADVVKGFWNGITSLGGWLKEKIGSFFGGIVDGVKSKLEIFSPSRVFRDEIGKMIVKGFGQGIDRNEKEAINPMNRMLDNVIGVFDSQTSGLGATFSVMGEGNIANAMNRALNVDIPMVNRHVSHSVNVNTGRTENLLEQLANRKQVIVLDTGVLVGETYSQYDRVGGSQTQLTERWGR